uniref:Uncharacterized protein n=1 Tax=Cacopsylla melanoneura TaxID=428564 RepID=A0A8D9AP83_9HEMI
MGYAANQQVTTHPYIHPVWAAVVLPRPPPPQPMRSHRNNPRLHPHLARPMKSEIKQVAHKLGVVNENYRLKTVKGLVHQENYRLKRVKGLLHQENYQLKRVKGQVHQEKFQLKRVKGPLHQEKFQLGWSSDVCLPISLVEGRWRRIRSVKGSEQIGPHSRSASIAACVRKTSVKITEAAKTYYCVR